ncbi:MAG TPA: lipoprotein insertase outer membrane protein LolB [Casimicrobiaceae bacterium]|nr:lipoprotein insertase outer membrane protein LolB [Casimicrobiaceae bacterium]
MRVSGRALAALVVTLIGACATTQVVEQAAPLAETAFEVAGRLSARRGNEGAAAGFRWRHRSGEDALTFTNPLGSTLAQLDGGPGGVRLTFPDGRVTEARDWEALTLQALGAPLPVRGLAWWIRGSPHPGSRHALERDRALRPLVLRQDGWEVVYGYRDDSARPRTLRLTYPDTEVRLAIDTWNDEAR